MLPVLISVTCTQDLDHFGVKTSSRSQHHTETSQRNLVPHAYLVEVFTCGSHLLPGFVQQLDADAEEFLEGAIMREEHGMEVVAVFTGCGNRKGASCYYVIITCKKAPV